MENYKLTHSEIAEAAAETASDIAMEFGIRNHGAKNILGRLVYAYPIPRGGVAPAYRICAFLPSLRLVDSPANADCFIDDLIDTGKMKLAYAEKFPGKPFFTLFNRGDFGGAWLVFPWEEK